MPSKEKKAKSPPLAEQAQEDIEVSSSPCMMAEFADTYFPNPSTNPSSGQPCTDAAKPPKTKKPHKINDL